MDVHTPSLATFRFAEQKWKQLCGPQSLRSLDDERKKMLRNSELTAAQWKQTRGSKNWRGPACSEKSSKGSGGGGDENSNGHVFASSTGHKDRPWCRLNGKCFTTMTRMIRWSCQQWLEIQRDIVDELVRKSWRKRRLNGNNWRQAEKSGYDAVDVSCEKLLRDSQTGASYQHRTHWPG